MASSIALAPPQPLPLLKRALGLIPGLLLLVAVGYAGKFIERSIALYGKAHHLTLPNIEYVLWAILIGLVISNIVGVPGDFSRGDRHLRILAEGRNRTAGRSFSAGRRFEAGRRQSGARRD